MTTIASLVVEIGSDISNFTHGMNQVDKQLDKSKRSWGGAVREFGSSVSGLGAQFSALTLPLAGAFAYGLKTASDFDSIMAEIGARAGLTSEGLAEISEFALQMGADTSFSGQQAAEAMLQLLTSGQNAEQAMATLPAILDAAAASGEGLGTTADTITDIMASFGLGVEDADEVVESLAKAAGASSASMGDLGQGFANVGGVARAFGLNVNRTSAVLALLSENGIKGAEAGSALKSMLLNMTRPTEDVQAAWDDLGTSFYDAEGNARELPDILDDIKIGMEDMSVEEQNKLLVDLGGSYGVVALQALLGATSIEEMEAAMAGASGAGEVAAARMDTFAGRMDSLMGSVETLMITALTPLMNDVLKPMAEQVTEVVNRVTEWAKANPELTSKIVALGAGLLVVGPALVVAGIGIQFMGIAISALGLAIGVLTSPLFLAAAGLLAIGAGLAYIWTQDIGGIKTKIEEIGKTIRETDFSSAADEFKSNLQTSLLDATSGIKIGNSQYLAQSIIASVFTGIDTGDWTGLSAKLQIAISEALTSVEGVTVDTSGVETWATTNMDSIISAVAGVAVAVIGGPVGLAIGAAKLISMAIENDFMGIGTFLNDSGITASVETAFNDLKTDIDTLLQDVFSGGGANTDQALAEMFASGQAVQGTGGGGALATFADDLRMGLDWLSKELPKITGPISDGLAALGDGIGGFIENLSGTETEGLLRIATTIGGAIGAIVTKLVELGSSIVGDVLTNIGAALPAIGGFINDFVSALSRLGEGDWSGMAQRLGDGLMKFVDAGLALVGIDLEPIITTLSGLWDSVSVGIEAFKTGMSTAFDWIKVNVLDPIAASIAAIQKALNDLVGGLGAYGGIADNLGKVVNSGVDIGTIISGLGTAIGQELGIPGAAVGADINTTGLVLAHAGERILNPGETRAYESGGGSSNQITIQGVQNVDDFLAELARRGIYLN